MSVSVRSANVDDLDIVRALFTEYVGAPHGETLFHAYLDQQDFASEIAGLPGAYRPPLGALLLAEHGAAVIGCVAIKPLAPPEICEMKRLYVRQEGRGLGAGHALVAGIIDAARNAGYRLMRLDCMPSMHDAQRLYRAHGFYTIPAYNENPVPGSLFFELLLSR
ncbi:MAG: GNAT family N-acetyltransferase [Gemmatimonadaceae bacterium]